MDSQTRHQGSKALFILGALALLPCATLIARFFYTGRIFGIHYDILMSDNPGFLPITWVGLGWLCGAIAIMTGLVGMIVGFFKKSTGVLLASPLLVLLGILPFLGLGASLSNERIKEVAERGNVIVAALEDYHSEHGEYPQELEALTPQYLETIPDTGLGSRRPYLYYLQGLKQTYGKWADHRAEALTGQAPYVLIVECVPKGTLVYRPDKQYEDIDTYLLHAGWAVSLRD